ncbi:MAG: cytochrome c oxidase accessory protein CcoG [Flavobacteriaceae bacterium]|nr:cytochrome c oxidase accessory protein CcoG [Flavobacteriaceae bacterium]
MPNQEKEVFRDSIATIDDSGKRNFIYPKKPKGKFTSYRTYVSWVLLTMLLLSPFAKINGNQFLLFNFSERKFNIFGYPFWPQDFYLLVISLLIGIVFIVVFTVIFGRIFCGWMCPQTIFMEMVFRKIEYAIEGDRNKQIKLNKQEWNFEKIKKKGLKWFLFFLISFLIANVFLAYFISSDVLLNHIKGGPIVYSGTFLKLLIFTAIFYFVFAWFREQVCIIVCPYGRLQGVLLDNKSINVAYDYKRGEDDNGRKKIRKNENRKELGHGDCIDCNQCVVVCPTGIDIRNGTQLECVNCTACIDACDEVMGKIGYEKGLIRYASEDNIAKGEQFKLTSRLKFNAAILVILLVLLVSLLFVRNNIDLTIVRLPGKMFYTEGANIKNVYTYKIINKTINNMDDISLRLINHEGKIEMIGGKLFVKKQNLKEGTIFILIPKKYLKSHKEKIKIGVYVDKKLVETAVTNFSGPLSSH